MSTIPPEHFHRFSDGFTAETVMPIIIDRFGREVADRIEQAVMEVIEHKAPLPAVRYPSY